MRSITVAVAAVVLLAQRATCQQQSSPEFERLMQASVAAAERSDLPSAIAMADSLLRQDSTVLNALWNLGVWHAMLNEPAQALTAWRAYHAQDSTDWHVEAKLIQTYQALADTARRDSSLAGLLRHRSLSHNPELLEAESFCREQTVIEGRRVMAFQTFAPQGDRMIFLTFYLLGQDGRDTARFSLGSYDPTTEVARATGVIGPDERLYHLDYYGNRTHATYDFFRKQPSYDEVRAMLVQILRGELKPVSGTTLGSE
jgi:hypothetical protein